MSQEENPVSLFFRGRLRALLAERELSQRQLAIATGVSQQTINNYLRGVTKLPGAEELLALSRYFGVTMESFLTEGENNRQNPPKKGVTNVFPGIAASEITQAANRLHRRVNELREEVERLDRLGGGR